MRVTDTRLPLWGRDQNAKYAEPVQRLLIPDCPCGGEIKTLGLSLADDSARYQIALVGARSKHPGRNNNGAREDTRLPLWGRDQNRASPTPSVCLAIPDCPCGGEIKTEKNQNAVKDV